MALFGDVYDPATGQLLHASTAGDTFANYFFALLFIVLFLLSSFCNPYVFFHYRSEKQNISAVLFQLLTINDFCTCLVGVPYNLYLLLGHNVKGVDTEVQTWQVEYTLFGLL